MQNPRAKTIAVYRTDPDIYSLLAASTYEYIQGLFHTYFCMNKG